MFSARRYQFLFTVLFKTRLYLLWGSGNILRTLYKAHVARKEVERK